MRINYLPLIFLSLSLVFALAGGRPIHAQGAGSLFTVNDSGDSTDASPGDGICADAAGQCTLRAAIVESNAGTQHNVIIFALPQPTVISLTLGELSIIKGLNIVGPGARRLTVQRSFATGTPNFRIFHVPTGQMALNIYGLTIRNGNAEADAGGGLFIESGNFASLTDVAVTGNRAMFGGGIAVFGRLTILRSLINSNVSDNQGGGITNSSLAANTTITSSTFTDNSGAFGGAINNSGGSLLLINDTISRNSSSQGSSSVFNAPLGTVQVLNTIIGRDFSQSVPMLQGAFQSLGNNLISLSGPSTGFIDNVNGDQVGSFTPIDPMLGNLADNGGQTDTLALQTGSTAINRGNNCAAQGQCPQLPNISIRAALDQRHYYRVLFGGIIDIGAFEAGAVSSSGGFGFGLVGGSGSTGRYLNSIAILTNATTLEKRYSVVRLNGNVTFNNIPTADAFVLEVKSKRGGFVTPEVIAFDF